MNFKNIRFETLIFHFKILIFCNLPWISWSGIIFIIYRKIWNTEKECTVFKFWIREHIWIWHGMSDSKISDPILRSYSAINAYSNSLSLWYSFALCMTVAKMWSLLALEYNLVTVFTVLVFFYCHIAGSLYLWNKRIKKQILYIS